MAFTYGFYNSSNGDRRYNAEQMSEIFDGILKDGIIPSIGQKFAVTTANNRMQIRIGTGRAWFHHTWSKNDSVMLLNVPASDVSRNRYDAVVLEVNRSDNVRANSIKIVSGSPQVNATKPTLLNTDKIHQYPLAYILVRAGTETISASDIENMVGRSPTVFATGVLETTPLDDLWSQWEGEWDDWFEDIKLQLSGNVATNLQLQIDQLRNSIPSKATSAETVAGSNDKKYTTPYTVKQAINAFKNTIANFVRGTYAGNGADSFTLTFPAPVNMLMISEVTNTPYGFNNVFWIRGGDVMIAPEQYDTMGYGALTENGLYSTVSTSENSVTITGGTISSSSGGVRTPDWNRSSLKYVYIGMYNI